MPATLGPKEPGNMSDFSTPLPPHVKHKEPGKLRDSSRLRVGIETAVPTLHDTNQAGREIESVGGYAAYPRRR